MNGKELLACLLLSLTVCGCGATGDAGPAKLPDTPAPEADLSDSDPAVEEAPPLDTVAFLPEGLIEELRDRMLSGSDTYEDFELLRIDRELSSETVAELAPECLCNEVYSLVDAYYAVDFDNDGIEDIFANRQVSMRATGLCFQEFWRGLSDGSYVLIYALDTYMNDPLFLTWEGRTYYLSVQRKLLDEWSEVRHYTNIGLNVIFFDQGLPQESVWLSPDPAALWNIYHLGPQPDCLENSPGGQELTLSVYTRGVNTDFPLPVH